MKRLFKVSLGILSLALLLTACGPAITDPADKDFQDAWDEAWSDIEKNWGENAPDMSKQHYYQVLDGQGEELYTITGETRTAALDDLLGNDGDHMEEAPADGEEIACIYVYWQEKTLLAGQDPETEREYEELIRFTVYQNQDLMTVQILSGLDGKELMGVNLEDLLTFTVSLSAETAKTLRDPAQFTE